MSEEPGAPTGGGGEDRVDTLIDLLKETRLMRTRLDEYVAFMNAQITKMMQVLLSSSQELTQAVRENVKVTRKREDDQKKELAALANIVASIKIMTDVITQLSNVAGRFSRNIINSVSSMGDVFLAGLTGYMDTMGGYIQAYFTQAVVRIPSMLAGVLNAVTGGLAGPIIAGLTFLTSIVLTLTKIYATLKGIYEAYTKFVEGIRALPKEIREMRMRINNFFRRVRLFYNRLVRISNQTAKIMSDANTKMRAWFSRTISSINERFTGAMRIFTGRLSSALRSAFSGVGGFLKKSLGGIARYLWMLVVLARTQLLIRLANMLKGLGNRIASGVGKYLVPLAGGAGMRRGAVTGAGLGSVSAVAVGALAGLAIGGEIVRRFIGFDKVVRGMENFKNVLDASARTANNVFSQRMYEWGSSILSFSQMLVEKGNEMGGVIGDIIAGFGLLISYIPLVMAGLGKLAEKAVEVGRAIKDKVESAFNWLKEKTMAVIRAYITFERFMWTLPLKVGEAVLKLGSALVNMAPQIATKVVSMLSAGVSAFTGYLSRVLPGGIEKAINALIGDIEGMGSKIVDAIVNLIEGAIHDVEKKITDIVPKVNIDIPNPLDWIGGG